MALLPKIPWVDMDDTRVAVDAPVSTDLWTDTIVNENYLKATLTDGASAPQGIATLGITANGTLVSTGKLTVQSGGADITGNSKITGDLEATGDMQVGGDLTVLGTFQIDDILLLLSAL